MEPDPPPPRRPDPFYVSDVAPPATHASFFLDPENWVLPVSRSQGAATSQDSGGGGSGGRVAAFPEEIQGWPGWRQSRFKATLWGRRQPGGAELGQIPRARVRADGLDSDEEGEGGWRILVEWEVDLAGLTSLGRDVSPSSLGRQPACTSRLNCTHQEGSFAWNVQPAAFPKLPPNTLVFALSTAGGAVPCFPDAAATLAGSSSRSAASSSSAAATNLPPAEQVEYFSAPVPLLERADRRRLRAARRARLATAAAAGPIAVAQVPQRSWSEDELSDYLLECCDDSDCSSCFGASDCGRDDGDELDRGHDDDGATGGHASDPGVSSSLASARGAVGGGGARLRSDTIRSRRAAAAAAAAGRRGTVVSLRRGDPLPTGRSATSPFPGGGRLRAVAEQDVLEKSRRETRMVRAAGWDEIRTLCEARWELEAGMNEVEVARGRVAEALGTDETGWAAQVSAIC